MGSIQESYTGLQTYPKMLTRCNRLTEIFKGCPLYPHCKRNLRTGRLCPLVQPLTLLYTYLIRINRQSRKSTCNSRITLNQDKQAPLFKKNLTKGPLDKFSNPFLYFNFSIPYPFTSRGGGNSLTRGEWRCAAGWRDIFTTGLTIMGSHFQ